MELVQKNIHFNRLAKEVRNQITIEEDVNIPDTKEDIEELDRRMTIVDKFNFPVKTDTVVFTRWGENEIPVKEYLEKLNK